MTDTPGWKGPTIREIAETAGVGPATVDRVLNNRPNVREKTRQRVMAAMAKLRGESKNAGSGLKLRLFCESGETFNLAMKHAMEELNRTIPGISLSGYFAATNESEPMSFAVGIEHDGLDADGVIVVAREHPAMNGAIRKLGSAGVPVICLTSDLPSSRRSAYIGNDQYAAGSIAGLLIGNALPRKRSEILLVMSAPFRSQQEREMGFRRALRSDFPHLRVDERVIADDHPASTRDQLIRHFQSRGGPPAAVYNAAGANRGVAQALEQFETDTRTFFVGHELNAHSRTLLEEGVMDYVISHDVAAELTTAVHWIRNFHAGIKSKPAHSQILLHTRYNCDT